MGIVNGHKEFDVISEDKTHLMCLKMYATSFINKLNNNGPK